MIAAATTLRVQVTRAGVKWGAEQIPRCARNDKLSA